MQVFKRRGGEEWPLYMYYEYYEVFHGITLITTLNTLFGEAVDLLLFTSGHKVFLKLTMFKGNVVQL